MKYLVLIMGLWGDFVLFIALIVGFCTVPKTTFLLSIPVYFTWKSLGGFSIWKKANRKKFLRNWDRIIDNG